MLNIPSAKELRVKIAQAEAEKHAFLERISKPSGLTDEQVLEKASNIVNRAVESGLTSVQVFRFPNHMCTDNGRAIDQGEEGWQKTLTGIPKELWSFYERQLKPRGYHMKYEIIDRPGGMRGDIAVFLSWD